MSCHRGITLYHRTCHIVICKCSVLHCKLCIHTGLPHPLITITATVPLTLTLNLILHTSPQLSTTTATSLCPSSSWHSTLSASLALIVASVTLPVPSLLWHSPTSLTLPHYRIKHLILHTVLNQPRSIEYRILDTAHRLAVFNNITSCAHVIQPHH